MRGVGTRKHVKYQYNMQKITASFEQGRKELLVKMSARSRKQPIKKVISFRNDDVPNYLRELEKFEEQSRQSNLVVC